MRTQVEGAAGPEVLAQVSEHLWDLLAEVDDPDSELTVSPATRRRIEGAALGLDVLTGRPRRVANRSIALQGRR